MTSSDKKAVFMLRVSTPGAFDSPVDFALLELTRDDAQHLLRLMDLAEGFKKDNASFDEIVFFDALPTFHGAQDDLGAFQDVIDGAIDEVCELGVVRLSAEVSLEEDTGFVDVRRMHVEPEAVYWSGLFDDDSRVETARVSRRVLEEFVWGGCKA